MRAGTGGREVLAVMDIEDGCTLELAVKLPAAWPLKSAVVECRRKVGLGSYTCTWAYRTRSIMAG